MILAGNVHISHSRVEKILAGVLKDDRAHATHIRAHATHMGLWDRFKDLFRGGAKQKALMEAFDWMAMNKGGIKGLINERPFYSEENTLSHFMTLLHSLKTENLNSLSLTVDVQKDTWTYQIKLSDVLIADGEVSSDAQQTRNEFLNTSILANLTMALRTKLDGHIADELADKIGEKFGKMDRAADYATLESPLFFAHKIEVAKHLLDGVVPFVVSLDPGSRAATITIAEKEVCTINDYSLSEFQSARWYEHMRSLETNRL